MLLESNEKTLQTMWAAVRPLSLISSMLLLWRSRHHVRNRRSPHKMTDSFDGLPRPTGFRQPPNCPKVELCFEGEKSLLQSPSIVSKRWPLVAANLQQNLCSTASFQNLPPVAYSGQTCTKTVSTDTQKSFLATNTMQVLHRIWW